MIELFTKTDIEKMKKVPESFTLEDGTEVHIDVLHQLAKYNGFEEQVPTVEQFIYDPYYLGKVLGDGFYPIWVKAMKQVFPTPYHSPYGEIVLTGAIGLGKSTFALAVMMYDLCKVLSLRNPNQHYKLIESTVIKYALMNATKHLAYGVLWSQFEDWVNASPYFKSKVSITKGNKKGKTYFVKNVDVGAGSRGSDFLGTATIGAIFSEINDMTVVAGQAEDNLDTIATRRVSRFFPSGKEIMGHLILDSSSKGNRSFIDARLEEKDKKGVKDYIVFSFTQWEAKWHMGVYSGKFFKVYAGDEYVDPFIVDETNEHRLAKLNPNRIIDVPVEHEEAFRFNIIKSLRDLAGLATYSTFSFIPSAEILAKTLIQPNPVTVSEVVLDFFDKSQTLSQYIDLATLKFLSSAPRYIHIDLGLKQDSTGIACTYLKEFIEVERLDSFTGKILTFRAPVFVTEWVMEIKSTPGQEVPIYKIQEFIEYAVSIGYPIALVSTDGFQSSNLRQNFLLKGIPTDLVSVDRTKDPYNELRNIILEGRTRLPLLDKLKKEISELEENDQKFDHPSDGCFTGDQKILLVDNETKEMIPFSFEEIYESYNLEPSSLLSYSVISYIQGQFITTDFCNPRISKVVDEIIELELEDGSTVKCTPDHRFLTTEGWKQAIDILETDEIISI